MRFIHRKILQFLSSLRFANLLLALLAFLTALGTLSYFFKDFPLDPENVFGHWAFSLLLGLIVFSILFDTVLKIFDREGLLRRGDSISSEPDTFHQFSKSSLGGPLLHLGFVIVLMGGLLTFAFSNIRDVWLPEGETVTLPGTHIKARLEKFSVVPKPGSSEPDAYISRLLLERKGKGFVSRDLKVNHPIRIGALKIFQMRYRIEVLRVDLGVYHQGRFTGNIRIKPGQKIALFRFPYFIEIGEVVPDFAIDQKGNVSSRTPYFLNPAVKVLMLPTPGLQGSVRNPGKDFWAFGDLFQHEKIARNEWAFTVQKIKKRYFSGIKMSCDPGAPVAYLGFILLVAGAFISGFVRYAQDSPARSKNVQVQEEKSA